MSGKRVNYYKHVGKAAEHLMAVEALLEHSSLDPRLLELVRLRVSQINGCSFCVNYHTQVLNLLEETPERICQAAVWEEAPCFTEQEKAAFRWAETLTKIADTRFISDELYQTTVDAWGEAGISELTMAVGIINTWNRLGIAFHSDHGLIDQLMRAKRAELAGV
ncbi:carboxymuconolactone decarboxylase family protein [Gimesia chilikensis]|uniref:Carboxymuconolactone decarboxylase family protein n=1 Tax=Gimesia chilikensis TaxID=2605989 RepID=A0A517PWZ0_9PLAN|nr:carboxymuconolactone decarboxylase family protein [Gimesia chilikensis]MBN69170.1 alkylhydroperoxidase [Gimesia sp.]MCR9231842.1 carboxymuconolactone decarboxylase family protein [bacterium]QDT23879.1 Carboxymuconolactone decarboxylase family protein [Gimesia chilikensis]QDT87681.1 Carboxymuconolactone decarboxylase family protein [Gimesia chilikensis]